MGSVPALVFRLEAKVKEEPGGSQWFLCVIFYTNAFAARVYYIDNLGANPETSV